MTPKILLLDDNDLELAQYRRWLRGSGYEVVTTSDPVCIDLIRATRPDLILIDIRLPGLEGDIICAILASSPEIIGEALLLLFSCQDPERLSAMARNSRAHGFIRKSAVESEFLSQVRFWADRIPPTLPV